MAEITLTIPGPPVAKGRPRMTKTGHTYTPEKTVNYENLVKLCYMQQCTKAKLEGPLCCMITADFPIPKSASKKKTESMRSREIRPTRKPDIDNIIKSVCDALNGLAYDDDSQIVAVYATKHYSTEPKVTITIGNTDCYPTPTTPEQDAELAKLGLK